MIIGSRNRLARSRETLTEHWTPFPQGEGMVQSFAPSDLRIARYDAWHLMVMAGSALHFTAVLVYIAR